MRRPGLYRLAQGARVADAIARAGGLTRRAERDRGQPRGAGRRRRAGARGHARLSRRGCRRGRPRPLRAAGPVSLSAATAEQLDTLPGVGPVTAQKIVAVPPGARPVHLGRRARRDPRDRARAARRPAGAGRAVTARRFPPTCSPDRSALGLAAANAVRLAPLHRLRSSSLPDSRLIGLAAPRAAGLAALGLLAAAAGWWWGERPARRARPQPAARRGRPPARALVEVTARPRRGAFDQRVPARVRRFGGAAGRRARPARAAARALAAAGRRRQPARRRAAAARARRTASTSARGCAATGSTSSSTSTSGTSSAAAAASAGSPTGCARWLARAPPRPGSRENGARSSKGSCSATTTGSRPELADELPRAPGSTTCSPSRARTSCFVAGGRARARVAARRAAGWAAARRARGDRRVRARGRPAAVRDPRRRSPVALASLAWLAGRAARRLVRAAPRGASSCSPGTRTSSSTRASSSRSPPSRRSSLAAGRSSRALEGYPVPPHARGSSSPSRRPAASRRRRSSGCSSARCRCSACSRTRSPSRPSALLLGLAFVDGGARPGRAVGSRSARLAATAGSPRTSPLCARLVAALPFAQASGAAAALAAASALGVARLCLAAMADELSRPT